MALAPEAGGLPDPAGAVRGAMDPFGFWSGRAGVAYSTTGAFVGWLLDGWGAAPVREVYRGAAWESAFGLGLDSLAARWAAHLRSVDVSPEAVAYTAWRFSQPSLFEVACPHHVPRWRRLVRDGEELWEDGDLAGALGLFRAASREPLADSLTAALVRTRAERAAMLTGDPAESARVLGEIVDRDTAALWEPRLALARALALSGASGADSAYARAIRALPPYAAQARTLTALESRLAPRALEAVLRPAPDSTAKVAAAHDLVARGGEARLFGAFLLSDAGDPARAWAVRAARSSIPSPEAARSLWRARPRRRAAGVCRRRPRWLPRSVPSARAPRSGRRRETAWNASRSTSWTGFGGGGERPASQPLAPLSSPPCPRSRQRPRSSRSLCSSPPARRLRPWRGRQRRRPAPSLTDSRVHTLQLYRTGDEVSLPVISLRASETLTLEFDILDDEGPRPLDVEFRRVDRDGGSALLPTEYLTGFERDDIFDAEPSGATAIPYTHYSYSFPNQTVGFKLGGMYRVRVSEPGTGVLFEVPFFVSENLVATEVQLGTRLAETGAVGMSVQPAARLRPREELAGADAYRFTVCFARDGDVSALRCAPEPSLTDLAVYGFYLPRAQAFPPPAPLYRPRPRPPRRQPAGDGGGLCRPAADGPPGAGRGGLRRRVPRPDAPHRRPDRHRVPRRGPGRRRRGVRRGPLPVRAAEREDRRPARSTCAAPSPARGRRQRPGWSGCPTWGATSGRSS